MTRDRYLDLVRVTCVLKVVVVHWLTARVWAGDGRIGAVSIVDSIPQLGVLGLVGVSSPALVFVGGMINRGAWAKYGTRVFLRKRGKRLLAPLAVFAAVWLVVELVLHALDVGGGEGVWRWVGWRGVLPFGPLWFIGVYLVLVACTPVTARLTDRFGVAVPVVLCAVTASVDVARFVFDVPFVGWLNTLLVWLVPHTLGHVAGRHPLSSRTAWLMTLGAVAALVVLTGTGWYPAAVGGGAGFRFSNMSPPTVCITALAVMQCGIVVLCRPLGSALLARPRVDRVVRQLNTATMTIYLWHMTAVLVGVLLLQQFGVADDAASTDDWLAQRPLWFAVDVVCLAVLVRLFRPVERIR